MPPRRNAADVVAAAAAAEGLSPAAAAAFAGLPDLTLRPCRASALPPELERATAALVRDNMDEVFAASGWDEADAEEGCAVGEPLYLLLLDARDALLGFVQCEFSVEAGEPALYVTELQLARHAQRRGLGARLTAAAEALAWDRGLAQVVLTVQTANRAALAFYARQGYGASCCSPELCPGEFEPEELPDGSVGFSYRILQKPRPRRAAEGEGGHG
mmetsp:Transcript_409/g.1281  ORF Transcript_409/g.1281 Transcript_409/m.1281 type:complete len:216 (+) Transcript_409:83-730(+)